MRNTVRQTAEFRGIGLHGGVAATARVKPSRDGCGIVFRRTDLPDAAGEIPARHDLVSDTRLCTRLTNGAGASIGTIEHLMAALAGLGITDAVVEVDGPEVPIMDGSAQPFVEGLTAAGTLALALPARAIRIRRPVRVEDGARSAALLPAQSFSARFEITFPDPAIGTQRLSLSLTGDAFAALAPSRTFCRRAEVEALRAMGLARGGSLENAIVVEGAQVLNPEGLRRPDEFVRHKILDAVGDLALAGAPIVGRYEGVRAGHEMTNRLLHALFAAPEAWEWVRPAPGQILAGGTSREVAAPTPEAVAARA